MLRFWRQTAFDSPKTSVALEACSTGLALKYILYSVELLHAMSLICFMLLF